MKRNLVPSDVQDPGFWAAERVEDRVLVDIASRGVEHQTRLSLKPHRALRLAGDLAHAAEAGGRPGRLHLGEAGSSWEIVRAAGATRVTFRDTDFMAIADYEATLSMPADDLVAMATAVAALALALLQEG